MWRPPKEIKGCYTTGIDFADPKIRAAYDRAIQKILADLKEQERRERHDDQ
jgi:hypothetical protein